MEYQDIHGWLQKEKADILEALIREHDVKSVLEIGSFLGRSAVFFAGLVDEVVCVDPFVMWPDGRENVDALKAGDDFYDKFMANIESAGVADNITAMRMTSAEAIKILGDRKFDLIYIDGQHDMDSVLEDLRNYYPQAIKVIVGDDYKHWPTVREGVHEFFARKEFRVMGDLWYALKSYPHS